MNRIGAAACRLALITSLAVLGPVAHAAHAAPPTQTPDLSGLVLQQADLVDWTQTRAVRDARWDSPDQVDAPAAPPDVSSFATEFTKGSLTLQARAATARTDLADAYFQSVQHGALGQTPIALPPLGQDRVAWWESAGDSRMATAAVRLGDLTVELHVTGVTPDDPVGDSDIGAWLSLMVGRSQSAATGAWDWSSPFSDQAPAWSLLLDSASVAEDWQQQTGLELTTDELGGQVQSVAAAREFTRTGAYRRTLVSAATVYASNDAASTQGLQGEGTAIPAPSLGDEATAFRVNEGGDGHDSPTVTYTINARRGRVVITTQETGVVWSLDSPDEAVGLARLADAHAAEVIAGGS